jgi:hypothetical protein
MSSQIYILFSSLNQDEQIKCVDKLLSLTINKNDKSTLKLKNNLINTLTSQLENNSNSSSDEDCIPRFNIYKKINQILKEEKQVKINSETNSPDNTDHSLNSDEDSNFTDILEYPTNNEDDILIINNDGEDEKDKFIDINDPKLLNPVFIKHTKHMICQNIECKKFIKKPISLDGKIYCVKCFRKIEKQVKKSITPICQHIFSKNSIHSGERCTSKTINNTMFCIRHQKIIKE